MPAPKKTKTTAPVGAYEESAVDVGTLKLSGDYEADETFVVNNESGLEIYVEKDVTIHTTGGKSAFILNADTTITGPGNLTVIVDDEGTSAKCPAAIDVNGCKLTLDNVRVKIKGCNGIRGKNKAKLNVNYSTVDIEAKQGALFDFYGNMTFTDTGIKEPVYYLVGSTAGFYDLTSDHDPVWCVYLCPERSVQSIEIADGANISIKGGESKKLTAVVTPSDAAKQEVTWKASNDNIKVSPDGTVTALKVGNATVTASCGGKKAVIGVAITSNAVDVEKIGVLPREITVGVGQTAAIRGSVTPGYASELSGFWYSDNTSVAAVANTGTISDLNAEPMIITGVAPGDAFVYMFSNGRADADFCKVHVVADFVAAEGVAISGDESRTMHAGDTATLSATVTPSNATDKTVIWTSSDPDVITVDQSGKLTAEGSGDATVTAEIWNGTKLVQSSVEIHVPYPVYGVGVSSPKSKIYVGGSVQLEAGVYPSTAENKAVAWESSDPSVATVDENGLVKGVGEGVASITATTADGGYTDSLSIAVEALPIHVTDVTADRTELTMPVVSSRRVNITVGPENADNKAWTWESTDESVARVTNCGDGEYVFTEYAEICSYGEGTATVTIRSEDGNRMAKIRVTALSGSDYVAVELIELPPEIVVALGSNVSILPEITPENASDKTVRVSVDTPDGTIRAEDGMIYADKLGTANITVQVGEQSTVSTVRVVNAATSMTISDETVQLAFGQTKQLSASVAPNNVYGKTVTWSSDNVSVVTVDESGKIKAVGYGEATITATNAFSGLTKTCKVSVINNAYDLFVNGEQLTDENMNRLPAGLAYAPATKTLTISGYVTADDNAALICSAIDGLTVEVTGNATLSSKRSALIFEENAVITGGKLTVNAPSAAAIIAQDGAVLTIRDAELTVNGATGILGGNGSEVLTVENSDVSANAVSAAVTGFDTVELTDCNIVAPKEAEIKDGAVKTGDTPAASVTILKIAALKLGDVDGDGIVTIHDATAIQNHLADIPTAYNEKAADTDEDGYVTINDATYIQLWLADLLSGDNIGKVI